MSHLEHRAAAAGPMRCFVLTVSDTRTLTSDASGQTIEALLTEAGHSVTARRVVKDDPPAIRAIVVERLTDPELDVIITTGGTGLSSRDGTIEAIDGLLEKRLDGFGELFRMLSFEEVGPAAMLSRACAGAARGKIVIALPGSEHAVRLAMVRLVVPELGHLVREAKR